MNKQSYSLIAFILFVSMLLMAGFTACRTGEGKNSTPEPVNDDVLNTSESLIAITATEQPTPDPTPEPTAEITPEPGRDTVSGRRTLIYTVPQSDDGPSSFDIRYYDNYDYALEIGCDPNEIDIGRYGPEAFAVESDVLYVMDTVNKRVLIYSGAERSSVGFDYWRSPEYIFVGGSRFYIADFSLKQIFVYDKEWQPIGSIQFLPEMDELDFYMVTGENEDGSFTVLTSEMKQYSIDPETGEWMPIYAISTDNLSAVKKYGYPEVTFTIDIGENTISRFLRADLEKGEIWLIVYYNRFTQDGILECQTKVCKYDIDGNLLRCMELDQEEEPGYNPIYNVYMSSNGTLYVMDCLKNRAEICRIDFGTAV